MRMDFFMMYMSVSRERVEGGSERKKESEGELLEKRLNFFFVFFLYAQLWNGVPTSFQKKRRQKENPIKCLVTLCLLKRQKCFLFVIDYSIWREY